VKFSIAVNMTRRRPDVPMERVASEALEMVVAAEALGFDVAWAAEHHSIEYTIAPNPLVLITYWAAHARRIRLGTAVITAPYWNPLRAAGEIALTDILTDGRLEVGFGRGAYQYEFGRMAGGMPQELGGVHLRELIPAVQKLWEGDYAHDGTIWKFPRATSVPKPLQRPHPPLWVAARDPDTYDWTAETAAEDVRVFNGLFYNAAGVVNGFPTPMDPAASAAAPPLTPEVLRDNLMFGTPDQVVERIRRYERLGVDHYCYGASFGLPQDVALRSLALFGRQVMPHFTATPAPAR